MINLKEYKEKEQKIEAQYFSNNIIKNKLLQRQNNARHDKKKIKVENILRNDG